MVRGKILLAGALVISWATSVGAGPSENAASEQMVCELSNDCAANEAAPEPSAPGETRRFILPSRPAASTANPSQQLAPHPKDNHPVSGTPRPLGRTNLAINFISGSANLSASGQALAQTFMQAIGSPKLSGKRFMIAGHTDAVGSRAYNLDLSRRRAQALVDYLVGQGASRSRFEVKGFGFDRPLPGKKRSAAANRRVEVVTLN